MMETCTDQPSRGRSRFLRGRHRYGDAMLGVWLVVATLALGGFPGHAQASQTRFDPPQCSGATATTGGIIKGFVPPEVDLGDDATTRAIVAQGFARLRKACPDQQRWDRLHYELAVWLYQGRMSKEAVRAAVISSVDRTSGRLGPEEEKYWNPLADERKRQDERKKQQALAEERDRRVKAEMTQQEQALAVEKIKQQARSEELKAKAGLDCTYTDPNRHFRGQPEIQVSCEVAPDIDLSRDEIAKDLFAKVHEETRSRYQTNAFRIILQRGGKILVDSYGFTNFARMEREKNEYDQRIQTLLIQRKVADPIIKNITDFTANPFVYEGKRVALYASLSKMFSATDGVFAARVEQTRITQDSPPTQKQDFLSTNEFFFVSGIPRGSIASTTDPVLIIGDVMGTTTLETTTGRQVSVPHLSFVALDKCTLSEWNSPKCS